MQEVSDSHFLSRGTKANFLIQKLLLYILLITPKLQYEQIHLTQIPKYTAHIVSEHW